MTPKRLCAFLRDGRCLFLHDKCKWEHDDAPCPRAVRRVVHVEGVKSHRMCDPHLETARGRFYRQTRFARKGDVYWSCKRKGRYNAESDASRAARKMAFRYGTEMFYYYCKYCEGYHLTKKKPRGLMLHEKHR